MAISEILVGKPSLDRDLMLAAKVKSVFIRGHKVCVISPSMESMPKYDEIISRYKAFEHQGDSEFDVLKHIDAAFDNFLEMGFVQPLSNHSLLVIEDFGRLLWHIQGDERLMHRLTNLIALANQREISLWIVADSHQTLSYPKYKTALKNFARTLFLSTEDFDKVQPEDWTSLHGFFQIVETYKNKSTAH